MDTLRPEAAGGGSGSLQEAFDPESLKLGLLVSSILEPASPIEAIVKKQEEEARAGRSKNTLLSDASLTSRKAEEAKKAPQAEVAEEACRQHPSRIRACKVNRQSIIQTLAHTSLKGSHFPLSDDQ